MTQKDLLRLGRLALETTNLPAGPLADAVAELQASEAQRREEAASKATRDDEILATYARRRNPLTYREIGEAYSRSSSWAQLAVKRALVRRFGPQYWEMSPETWEAFRDSLPNPESRPAWYNSRGSASV